MNKAELIDAFAESAATTKSAAASNIDGLISIITNTLRKGESIDIVGFGSFKLRKRSARKARNPKTGAEVEVAAAIVPVFKAGKALKDAVKNAQMED